MTTTTAMVLAPARRRDLHITPRRRTRHTLTILLAAITRSAQ